MASASIHPNPSKRFPEGHKVRYRIGGRAGARTFANRQEAEQFTGLIKGIGVTRTLELIGGSTEPKRGTGPTVDECVERYIAQRPNPTTRATYRRRARVHISPTLGKIRVNNLTTEQVQLWLNSQTGSSTNITHNKRLLSGALRMAVKRGEIRANPAEDTRIARTLRKKESVFLSRDEYALVLKAVPRQYRTFIEFLTETGCRFGEAAALRPENVNLDRGTVHFAGTYSKGAGEHGYEYSIGPTKSEASNRTIRVRQSLLERLDLSHEFVFLNKERSPINGDSFRTNVWLPAMERTGLPAHRQPRLHDLRHTHASWLLDAGVSLPAIQKRLGHADIMTTLRAYSHPATSSEDVILAALEDLN